MNSPFFMKLFDVFFYVFVAVVFVEFIGLRIISAVHCLRDRWNRKDDE